MVSVRSLLLCAFVGSLGGAAGCKHDADRVAALVAAIDMLEDAQCKCVPAGDECGSGKSVGSACEQRVVRKHEEALGGWLECAIDATREQADCVRAADCTALDQGACGAEADDVCGEAPESAARAIESDIDRLCEEDDEGDDDGDSAGSSDSSGTGGVAFDAGTPTPPPALMPPPPAPQDPPRPVDTFACANGKLIPGSAVCDNIADCAEATDEEGCLASGIAATIEMCVRATAGNSLLTTGCITCACSVAPMAAVTCDADCWGLIECVLRFCPEGDPDSPDRLQCVVDNCGASIDSSETVAVLGPAVTSTCSNVCQP